MNKLFNALCEGLVSQGYKDEGGNNENYRILSKDGCGIKVYRNDYFVNSELPYIVTRYYFKKGE